MKSFEKDGTKKHFCTNEQLLGPVPWEATFADAVCDMPSHSASYPHVGFALCTLLSPDFNTRNAYTRFLPTIDITMLLFERQSCRLLLLSPCIEVGTTPSTRCVQSRLDERRDSNTAGRDMQLGDEA